MAWQEGDVYQRPDSNCGCEVTVAKGLKSGQGGDKPPTCCCGNPMQKKS